MKDELSPHVKIYPLAEGYMPKRETEEAIGYDVRVRAIVSANEMDVTNPKFRKTLFDFDKIVDQSVERFIEMHVAEKGSPHEPAYRLEAGKMALCGIGFCTEMPFSLCYLTLPRSGLASKKHVIIANAPGTVDPDYRGEAGIVLYNCGTESFYIHRRMRIAQILFTWAVIPHFNLVASHTELSSTNRGSGGFGSTGTK